MARAITVAVASPVPMLSVPAVDGDGFSAHQNSLPARASQPDSAKSVTGPRSEGAGRQLEDVGALAVGDVVDNQPGWRQHALIAFASAKGAL